MKVRPEKFHRNVIFSRWSCLHEGEVAVVTKKGPEKPLGSNVENGFGVIFLHANEIIMRALRAYQKQAFISSQASRDVIHKFSTLQYDHHRHLQTFLERSLAHANQQNAQHHVNIQSPLSLKPNAEKN